MAMPEYKSQFIYMWQNLSRTVYDFIRSSRKYVTLPAPTNAGDTVVLYLSAPETVVNFTASLDVDFNLDVKVPNAKLGDKLYLIITGTGSGAIITSTGALNFNDCGPDSPPSDHTVDEGTTIIPLMFDGTNFYGLDYC